MVVYLPYAFLEASYLSTRRIHVALSLGRLLTCLLQLLGVLAADLRDLLVGSPYLAHL
jgi:hypothetical protein